MREILIIFVSTAIVAFGIGYNGNQPQRCEGVVFGELQHARELSGKLAQFAGNKSLGDLLEDASKKPINGGK